CAARSASGGAPGPARAAGLDDGSHRCGSVRRGACPPREHERADIRPRVRSGNELHARGVRRTATHRCGAPQSRSNEEVREADRAHLRVRNCRDSASRVQTLRRLDAAPIPCAVCDSGSIEAEDSLATAGGVRASRVLRGYGVMEVPFLTMNAQMPPPLVIGLLSFVDVPGVATSTRYSSGSVPSCSAEYVALALSSEYSNCHRPAPVIGALSLVDTAGASNATSYSSYSARSSCVAM